MLAKLNRHLRAAVARWRRVQRKAYHKAEPILIDAIIDRVFRSIEMTLISTLVHVLGAVVNSQELFVISYGLLAAAGLYLGIPVARWYPARNTPVVLRLMLAALIGVSFVAATVPIWSLATSTFEIDREVARRVKARLDEEEKRYNCLRAIIPFVDCPRVDASAAPSAKAT